MLLPARVDGTARGAERLETRGPFAASPGPLKPCGRARWTSNLVLVPRLSARSFHRKDSRFRRCFFQLCASTARGALEVVSRGLAQTSGEDTPLATCWVGEHAFPANTGGGAGYVLTRAGELRSLALVTTSLGAGSGRRRRQVEIAPKYLRSPLESREHVKMPESALRTGCSAAPTPSHENSNVQTGGKSPGKLSRWTVAPRHQLPHPQHKTEARSFSTSEGHLGGFLEAHFHVSASRSPKRTLPRGRLLTPHVELLHVPPASSGMCTSEFARELTSVRTISSRKTTAWPHTG